ncbi:GAF domain-containing protein [Nakamurella panacisegetis]|uniref:GAF domain-containing protein n=1 Tax=Nakamurella panacisegetis TaxID=1090615 RepID=A0A1H0RAN2_9ACTN|nr:GAF and ANTAR domain-containing protein [Nakamurella panacisegetis]SDP26623.1 GAF domain-containing protein [Nakamurella panacisegetis]
MTSQQVETSATAGQPSINDTGTRVGDDDLAEQLTVLARDLQRLSTPQEVMDHIVFTVVEMVPGAQDATITVAQQRKNARSAAASSERARLFDVLQSETRQGPCLDALFEQETVRVDDLASEPRWPQLSARAGELGARSVVCFQLFVTGETLGSLDILATEQGAFSDESEHVGLLFASHAAIALADAQELENVRSALVNRDVIGQAKGILMERFKITPAQAFLLLAKASQQTNRKLYEVAANLAHTGTLSI